MKSFPYYELGTELDRAIKRGGKAPFKACLDRAYAGAFLLNKMVKNEFGVEVGILKIYNRDRGMVTVVGPPDYSIDDEPQRTLSSGHFHAWMFHLPTATIVDLSGRHFADYDTKGHLGSFSSVPAVVQIPNASERQFGDLSVVYLANLPVMRVADEQNYYHGLPDHIWQVARDAGKAFRIKVPGSARRSSLDE